MANEKNRMEKKPEIDVNDFHTFFKENYCTIEYEIVRNDFLEIADRGLDELFTENTDFSKVTRRNYIVYLRSEAYCDFEAVVIETFDAVNEAIADAVMEVSLNMERQDEITGEYWETCEQLLKEFLGKLYEEKIAGMIAAQTKRAAERKSEE